MSQTFTGTSGNDTYRVSHTDDQIIERAGGGTDRVYSSVSYTLPTHVEELFLTGSTNIYGFGNNSNNLLTGNSGNNRLFSGRGDDVVYGGAGNDLIHGGEGSDLLYGEQGNDIYLVNLNPKGHDTITDSDGLNTVKFTHIGNGTEFSDFKIDIVANETGGKDWIISSRETGQSVTLKNQENDSGTPAVSTFIVGSGNSIYTYSHEDFLKYVGSSQTATPGNDTIYGSEGNDYLDGGAGNDRLEGNRGSDTYYFGRGSGNDVIFDFGIIPTPSDDMPPFESANNTVRFGKGITPRDLEITRIEGYDASGVQKIGDTHQIPDLSGDTWVIRIKDTGETLTILNQHNGTGAAVNKFVFDNYSLSSAELAAIKEIDTAPQTHKLAENHGYVLFGPQTDSISHLDTINIDAAAKGRLLSIQQTLDGLQVNTVNAPAQLNAVDFVRNNAMLVFVPYSGASDGRVEYRITYGENNPGTTKNEKTVLNFNIEAAAEAQNYITVEHGNKQVIIARTESGFEYNGNAKDELIYGSAQDDTIRGGAGSDVILGNGGQDKLYGGNGDDVLSNVSGSASHLYGENGDDILKGGWGNDILDGGAGNDSLYGGEFHDTYLFGKGSGQDTVEAFESADRHFEGNDTVSFGGGLTPQDLTLSFKQAGGKTDWIIGIKGTKDTLVIAEQSGAGYQNVEHFKFGANSYTAEQFKALFDNTPAAAPVLAHLGSDNILPAAGRTATAEAGGTPLARAAATQENSGLLEDNSRLESALNRLSGADNTAPAAGVTADTAYTPTYSNNGHSTINIPDGLSSNTAVI